MPQSNLPTYAIVELLIRLEKHHSAIGNYKNHTIYDDYTVVKTTHGTIEFPKSLIMQQFEFPELITDDELANVAMVFKTAN